MPDTKITALTAIGANPIIPSTFPIPMVDLTDTSMAASGTTKKVTVNQILGAGGTATLASATITGNLTVDTNTFFADSANNAVGVGTASPTANTLTIGANRFIICSDSQSKFGDNGLINGAAADGNTQIQFFGSKSLFFNEGVATRMTLNSTGLGVGQGTINAKVDAQGASSLIGFRYIESTSGSLNRVQLGAGSGFAYIDANASLGFPVLQLRAAGNTAVTIDSSLNVGIGVTPGATDSNYYQALEIARVGQGLTCVKTAFTSTPNSWLSNNSYATYSAGTVWKYAVSSQSAAQYRLAGGEHQWFNAPNSGVSGAGTNITFTQAMTLDASGRLILLASTTTPATLATNGELTFTATSNTNLRFSYRGSDGVTRTADLTLA